MTKDMLTEMLHGLEKGLEVLAILNGQPEWTVAEVVRGTGLPRTTALRVLETLRVTGYIDRNPRSRKYFLTIKVRSLSDGYDDEAWITALARPLLRKLAQAVVWPVFIATPAGSTMLFRENTDHESPLALTRHGTGLRVPVIESAAGRVFLAHCGPEERRTVLELVSLSAQGSGRMPLNSAMLDRTLREIRERGWATYFRKHHKEAGIAVPVLSEGRYLASLGMRFVYGAMTEAEVVEKYLDRLRDCADKIGGAFTARASKALD